MIHLMTDELSIDEGKGWVGGNQYSVFKYL